MADVMDVAAYVLQQCGSMTTMKMQKLVYYAQAQSLAQYNRPLFSDDFQAWRGGPVCVRLFRAHRGHMIIRPEELAFPQTDTQLTESEREIIESICVALKDLSGNQLSERTHKEDPWKSARGDLPPAASSQTVITQDSIRAYYAVHPVIQVGA